MTISPRSSFHDAIEANKNAESAPSETSTLETPEGTRLSIRKRGCFVTDFSVIHNGERVPILYSDADSEIPKLTASHVMSPAGPSEGIGGQHGFARWADYHEFMQLDETGTGFQAKRSDFGPGISKLFQLSDDSLATSTTLTNYEPTPIQTSIGEHLYFYLEDELTDGLLVDDETIDQKFGDGALASIMSGEAFFWPGYDGTVRITFPAGRTVLIDASVDTKADATLGMLIWHKPGTPSICFEPTVGYTSHADNTLLEVDTHQDVSLVTRIKVLP